MEEEWTDKDLDCPGSQLTLPLLSSLCPLLHGSNL